LSLAFDMPTLYGYDPDNPRSEGEVGKCGVSVATVRDMEIIFDGQSGSPSGRPGGSDIGGT
jgi:methylmalonyl-CoA mutase N-terminal domain/subunit